MSNKIFHNGQYIEIGEGKLPSREVAATWLESACHPVRYETQVRFGHSLIGRGTESLLTEEEFASLQRVQRELRGLQDSLRRHPLEMLAAEGAEEDKVEKILDDYHGEVYNLGEVDKLRMALLLLDEVVGEDTTSEIRMVLAGEATKIGGFARRKGPIHACAWCNGEGSYWSPSYRRLECVRCEDGFVYTEDEARVEAEDEVPSQEGCKAISAGEPWTLEQEAEAWGYDSLADYLESEGQESLDHIRKNLEYAERFRKDKESA